MKIVVYAVIAATIPKFTGSGHRRCERATAFGSCSINLMMKVNGITTTSIATTSADIHAGILDRAPAAGSEPAFDTIAVRAIRRGPFSGFEGGQVSLEQARQPFFRFLTRVLTAEDFHRRLQVPQLPDGTV